MHYPRRDKGVYGDQRGLTQNAGHNLTAVEEQDRRLNRMQGFPGTDSDELELIVEE